MNTRVARVVAVAGVCVLVSATTIGGQTVITPPDNKYTLEEDVELGRQAADEVQQQLPMLADEDIRSWVSSIGQRIVTSIPRDLQHPGFRYAFQVVNVREINAFALPGGPMYLNRGMIEAARTQGEVASVIAHEISHVALRHGTAQATKATKYEIGALVGAVVGSIIGGNVGSAVSQGTQFGLGTAFLRFSREFERQADLLGSHLMAASGYDPLEMASMFKTIEKQGGSWRAAVAERPSESGRSLHRHHTRSQAARGARPGPRHAARSPGRRRDCARWRRRRPPKRRRRRRGRSRPAPVPDERLDPGRVAPPSSTYTAYTEGDLFRSACHRTGASCRAARLSPSRPTAPTATQTGRVSSLTVWRSGLPVTRRMTCAPRPTSSSPRWRAPTRISVGPPATTRATIGGRQGLRTVISNVSDATGQQERIAVFTVLLRDANLFYALGVAPRERFADYEATFRRVVGSIQFMD